MSLQNSKEIPAGIRFPGEFEPHEGTLMVWPERPGSWGKDSSGAERAFTDIIEALLEVEKVWLVVSPKAAPAVRERFAGQERLTIIEAETDDSWARDIGPTFVFSKEGRLAVNWSFNAWGGEVDGLYASWEKDDRLARTFAAAIGNEVLDAAPFVLEGGSIHTDGEGTLMVTESCLLSAGRNPSLTKAEIEERLKTYLGVAKVLWLPRGIYMDETNEHVDNVVAFIRPGEVVLAWTDNREDPQYELSAQDLAYLEGETDAKGRKIKVRKLPIPDVPVCCSARDIDNYVFEPGEDTREAGERLAASYVNFYFANGIALVPQFGGENAESDARAVKILVELCPERRIVPISARDILLGGGNIHCITQQVPGFSEKGRR
ncbi:MAG: agmatine deiminase [Lachnospiraceae bacterium]|nr:agmatine deiminase [Lachnospiraceae bacterium]